MNAPEQSAQAQESTAATVARSVASGLGSVVVGPFLAAALETPEVRAAVRGYTWQIAIGVGVAVTAGVALGLWLGKRR